MAYITSPLPIESRGNDDSKVQAAIINARELRALHAAILHGASPSHLKILSPSSVSRTSLAPQDYPVFTPSYEEEPLPRHHKLFPNYKIDVGSWHEYELDGANSCPSSTRDSRKASLSSIKGIQASNTKSTKTLENFHIASSSDCRRPTNVPSFSGIATTNSKHSNVVIPLTDSHSSAQSPPQSRGVMSRLFSKLGKTKKEQSKLRLVSDVTEKFKDCGMVSVEGLTLELLNSNESRDAALREVAQLKSSMGELRYKLEYLEGYCQELKDALHETSQARPSMASAAFESFPCSRKSDDRQIDNSMPVSNEAMVEGFVQIVSEARLSVSQFCRTLVGQVDEKDMILIGKLNSLLQPYKLSLSSKHPKSVLYHVEAIINQSLYQDFENPIFQRNGSTKHLDPEEGRHAQFSSFVSLRNLSWNQVLKKGTKYYSEEFSNFCDLKMSGITATLSWTRSWPEQLLQTFFVASKCIWLLHLLAFSFSPPIAIMRVAENRCYDSRFMDDIFAEKQRMQCPSSVKTMVMPGFYIPQRVLKSKVICKYRSIS